MPYFSAISRLVKQNLQFRFQEWYSRKLFEVNLNFEIRADAEFGQLHDHTLITKEFVVANHANNLYTITNIHSSLLFLCLSLRRYLVRSRSTFGTLTRLFGPAKGFLILFIVLSNPLMSGSLYVELLAVCGVLNEDQVYRTVRADSRLYTNTVRAVTCLNTLFQFVNHIEDLSLCNHFVSPVWYVGHSTPFLPFVNPYTKEKPPTASVRG
ncbi:hypothetical protein ISREJYDI_CDS0070 [Pseudomonas phage UNO-G1W1]|uniref:Uncharacterized protein n=1 Tax=Pseudomonas phage UNO-G1W1 TaxID=3136609 RepID=A0AAX4QLR2_9CAUD